MLISDYEELGRVIAYMQSKYEEVTRRWNESTTLHINLRRTYMDSIDGGQDIYASIFGYVQLLNEVSAEIFMDLSLLRSSLEITSRVKAQNSIEYKITSYKGEKHEFGKIPLNKCLNDLFGVRVILPEVHSFQEIRDFVDQYAPDLKCINSSKGEYRATHLYFKLDNFSFPWELQIWNQRNKETNFESHKQYKQGYTVWENENKKGGITNG